MLDVFKVADLLVSHAIKNHAEKVDAICYYGSYAQGTAKPHSDLDIFYIPAPGTSPPIDRTFLIDGILFDFWGLSWETLEGFATGTTRGWANAPALVHQAKLLHTRSDQQVAQFAALKQKTYDLQKPEARPEMIARAMDAFKSVQSHLGNLRLATVGADPADIRYAGWGLIHAACECLALANQVFFEGGGPQNPAQLSRLSARPDDLEDLVSTIATSTAPDKVADAADRLAFGTRQVLRECQQSLPPVPVNDRTFHGNYPETHDQIRKLRTACEQQQPIAASAATYSVQNDWSNMLADFADGLGSHHEFNLYSEFATAYREADLPDLLASPVTDLPKLAQHADKLDEGIQRYLTEQSINLHVFDGLADFQSSL